MANWEVHSTPPRPAAVAAAVLDSAAEDAAVAAAAERVPAVAINPVAAVTGPAAATVPAAVPVARAGVGQELLIPAFVSIAKTITRSCIIVQNSFRLMSKTDLIWLQSKRAVHVA
jgi:hypothetical protein